MDLKRIIDCIATNPDPIAFPDDAYRVVPAGRDEDGRVLMVVDGPLSDAERDDLRFMFNGHIREISTDTPTFERLRAFSRSRLGPRGNGSGYHGEIDCDVVWRYKCPKDWAKLAPTGDPWSRHCETCNRAVVMCSDQEQINAARRVGACVAITEYHDSERFGTLMGELE
jgi:hypothetical protein